jgi:hypothetical protein
MATIRQSRMVNMDDWRPVPAPTPPPPLPSADDSQRNGRSPFMLSSMPSNASGNDGLNRQFYDGSNAPTTRIFTPGVDS